METEDGNEDVCGACTDIGDLICCESCPAAYHADCAGYVNPQEVPAGDWYCWSCCIQLKRGFPFPSIRFRQEPGSIVYVAIEGRLDTFLRATLEQLGPDNCTVLYNEKRDHATRNKREQLGRRNHRLWHGTADPKAWERGLARGEWHPLSRRYAVAQGLRAPAAPAATTPAVPAATAPAAPAATAPAAPATTAPAAPAATAPAVPAAIAPAAAAAAPVKRVRSRSRSTPPIVQSAYTAPPALHLPPVGVPVRPTANPSRAPSAAPRSILVGTTIMGPVMYRPHAPVMPSFPANPSQPQAQPPSRLSHPAPAASSHSQSRAKKRAPKKRRHSKIPSSEEEESSLASGETDTDDPNSDTQDSDFGGSGSVAHVKQQKAGKANAGSAAAATSGAVSKEEEEQFLKALTKFWQGQGSVGRKMLAKYQPFESIRLTSGMPPFSAYHFWAAVMALGGHSVAVEWKAWAAVGRLFSAPRSMTTVSHTFKTAYEKLLLPFEEATKKGETGVAVPPVTGRLPPMVKGRHPVQPSTSQGGHTGPSSSGASLQSQSFSDESSDSEAPRDRQKYLRVMTESRGRVRDYGESPRKRARLAVEGFTWGCPSMPSAAELADTDRILVAAESVMSQQAADLAPGTAVEYRSREAYLIGGWFRATIRQVEAGSAAEGGRRFLLDCTDFDGDRDNQSNLQEWVPLVYPDANSAVPYVMIRLPLQPERPPAPDHAWKKGDRVEGFWQNAWWTSTVKDIEEDGTVVCLSDATPVYPEGEEWEVERENLRAGHPQEALAFGMLNLANAPAALPQSAWRAKIKARKFRVDGFTIEAFACQLHLGDTTAVLPEEEEDPGKHARPRTDPTDRHSPSPGTTSGTTQSVPGGSSPDQPPIQATDGGQDRAQQKVVSHQNTGSLINQTSIPGTLYSNANEMTAGRSGRLSNSADCAQGQGFTQKSPVLYGQGHSRSPGQVHTMLARGASSCSPSPRTRHEGTACPGPADHPSSAAQQAAAVKQKPHSVHVKEEPWDSGCQQMQQPQFQPSWQEQGDMGQQGIAVAQRAQQVRQFVHPYSHLNGSFPSQQAGSSCRAQPRPCHLPPSFSYGSMFPSQSGSHAQHLGQEPSAFPSADDEAQLFFNQQPNQTPRPAPQACSQQPHAAVQRPWGADLHAHQHHDMWLLQQQHQPVQEHHWQQHLLQQGRQQQRQQGFPPSGFLPTGFPPPGFLPSEDAPQQGPWIPHLQAHLSLPLQGAAPTGYTHYHSSSNTPQQQQQHVPRSNSMHGWPHHTHSNSGGQRAQHGINGFVNVQHGMGQSGSQQAQQAGSNHSVQSMRGSMQSLQGGHSQRAAGCSSTAFILWVDGQLKQRGQTEKRAALRQFIQASRDSSSPPEASKQLFALIGHDMIREWQAALRAGQIQVQP
ncbi:TPA: hypothetical protein ACH3X2_007315 [Trebouxia sp. C0005]